MTDEKECPECGGKMILNEEHNETVCVDCGLVETGDDVELFNYTSNNTEEVEESHSDDDDLVHKTFKVEHTDSDGLQDQPDAPSACLECGSEDIEPAKNKSDQFVCSNCKLVMYKRDHSKLPENRFSDQIDDFARADWSQQYDTAIVGLIKEPYRTYHEYYRIENPREFFEDCSNEQEQLRRIKDSGLEPFETLDLPQIDWRFSTH